MCPRALNKPIALYVPIFTIENDIMFIRNVAVMLVLKLSYYVLCLKSAPFQKKIDEFMRHRIHENPSRRTNHVSQNAPLSTF